MIIRPLTPRCGLFIFFSFTTRKKAGYLVSACQLSEAVGSRTVVAAD